MMKTETELLNEYLAIRPLIVAGNMTGGDMNDEQQAGCLIKNAGSAEHAMEFIQGMQHPIRTVFIAKWPKVEALLKTAHDLFIQGIN